MNNLNFEIYKTFVALIENNIVLQDDNSYQTTHYYKQHFRVPFKSDKNVIHKLFWFFCFGLIGSSSF